MCRTTAPAEPGSLIGNPTQKACDDNDRNRADEDGKLYLTVSCPMTRLGDDATKLTLHANT
jgi:hypothetical protein